MFTAAVRAQTGKINSPVQVTVDPTRDEGPYVRSYRNNNWCDSFHFPESFLDDLIFLAGQGVTLDRLRVWPGLSGERNDNYLSIANEAAQSLTLPIQFPAGKTPAEFKPELLKGLRRLKLEFSRIRDIECGNEPDLAKISPEAYYQFYRVCYETVAEINAELKPATALKVGGPVGALYSDKWLSQFLDLYAQDKNPAKHLDFISYHMYGNENGARIRDRLSVIAGERAKIEIMLQARSLPIDTPSYITETGVYPGAVSTPDLGHDLLAQAAGSLTEFFYFSTSSRSNVMYNWAIRHKANVRKDALVRNEVGHLTPYGNVLLMESRLKESRVHSESSGVDAAGNGVNVFATKDKHGIAVMLWNYHYSESVPSSQVSLTVEHLPDSFVGRSIHLRSYRLDQTHSNYLTNPQRANLESDRDEIIGPSELLRLTLELSENAVCLVELSPVGEATQSTPIESPLLLPREASSGIRVDASVDRAAAADTLKPHASSPWRAATDGDWIEYILPGVAKLSTVAITFPEDDMQRLRLDLLVSLGGDHWTPVWRGQRSAQRRGQEVFRFPETSARFLRLVVHDPKAGIGHVVFSPTYPDFLVGSAPSGEYLSTTALSEGRPSPPIGFKRATQGQEANPGATVSGLFEFDLGSAQLVSHLGIAFKDGASRRYSFEILMFDPERGWKVVRSAASSGASAGVEDFAFPETTTRYLMIYGHGNDRDSGFYITQLRQPTP